LSPNHVVDLYGLRIRLEAYACELAAVRITEAELGELVAAADEFGDVRSSIDVETIAGVRRLNEANRRFHDTILAAARHHRLAAMIGRTVDDPLVFQAFRMFGPAEIERSDLFHHLIADAIGRREAGRAAALMAEHIAQGRDAVLDAMALAPLPDGESQPL
jgi:DNA-binding GntR family transcriptional regulator